MKQDHIKRISLWSGPRNISTTLMYSFAQRHDTKVFDEPLYGYYLKNNQAAKAYHPGADEILKTMSTNGEKVVNTMLTETTKPVLFFKNMTHHLPGLDYDFLKHMVNIILTRHPEDMLTSYAKVILNPKMHDVGYKLHVDVLRHLQSQNIPVVILDAKKVLLNPKQQLQKLCEFIGISFKEAMLSWPVGARPEDGSWAKYWYTNVHSSTGFLPYQAKVEPFPEHLKPLLEECLPYYEELLSLSL
ncbi:sulfotransferase family protein [Paucihalobacter sp.]|uniref:sulfotransferase-like domain-containing protein n=1 Tax=Paucihalobacter sp. TaxID=2850405 RepID=UPI002FE22DB1